jgi:hypothetical protein
VTGAYKALWEDGDWGDAADRFWGRDVQLRCTRKHARVLIAALSAALDDLDSPALDEPEEPFAIATRDVLGRTGPQPLGTPRLRIAVLGDDAAPFAVSGDMDHHASLRAVITAATASYDTSQWYAPDYQLLATDHQRVLDAFQASGLPADMFGDVYRLAMAHAADTRENRRLNAEADYHVDREEAEYEAERDRTNAHVSGEVDTQRGHRERGWSI